VKAGFTSEPTKMLVSLWKTLIDEMGGVDGGGTIIHYAHSIGATDTLNALALLTPEERKLNRVVTFGSPTLIEEGICGKADNYISEKDVVPSLDRRSYAAAKEGKIPNIHFLPSDSAWPVDHLLGGKTYRSVLETLGQQVQEEFLLCS
jgi:hypothetical protein